MAIFKIVLSPRVAIPPQAAKRECAPHSYVLHKVHLNTQLPSTFNGNGPRARQEADPWIL